MSSLGCHLYGSRAPVGHVLRYSAYSRDSEGLVGFWFFFFQKQCPGICFEYGLNTNTNSSNMFFTFICNGEHAGRCKVIKLA